MIDLELQRPAGESHAVPLSHAFVGVAACPRGQGGSNEHDRASRDVLTDRIARLLGVPNLGPHGLADGAAGTLFFVPGETLTLLEAEALGIMDAGHLFGGVVPEAFVATKAITHGLVSADAARPAGWSAAMREALGDAVIAGFTAFSIGDALAAGRRLLADGPVRVKETRGKAGLGQYTARDETQLAAILAEQDPAEIETQGIVIEENLIDVVTYSVGTAVIGRHQVSYWGTQRLTPNHYGEDVYGGSELVSVRGDLSALLASGLDPLMRHVVGQAERYDRAAQAAYPAMFASRRNYDVIEGTDARGTRRTGVLEQSWRIGGASGAELAAMEALHADPGLASVRTATVETYGRVQPPAGSILYYHGVDPVVGPLTKCVVVLP